MGIQNPLREPAVGKLLAEDLVRDVPDFPKPGIVFKDITPVMQNHAALQEVVTLLADWTKRQNAHIVAGIEARGFILGAPVALAAQLGFVPLRKLGKLPYESVSEEYSLEYGTSTVEMHIDSFRHSDRVVIIDDLLATGGTAAAAARLVERLGGHVAGLGFLIELDYLSGRKALGSYEILSLIHFS